MELGIKDKIAIVTGASKGIGLAITKAYLKEGVKVMMVSRDENRLLDLVKKFKSEGATVDFIVGDVADNTLANKVVLKTIRLWGDIHILINNAGGPIPGSFLDHDDNEWDKTLQTNLMSVVRFSKEVIPSMKKNGWGRVISITSTIAKEPSPAMVLSATARAGVSAFSKAISTELAEFNISVNVICPGGVLTDRLVNLVNDRASKENRDYEIVLKESEMSIPAKRFADPIEIANTVLFLTSNLGGYITGVSLSVDGGVTKSF